MSIRRCSSFMLGLFVCAAVVLFSAAAGDEVRECTSEDWVWQYTTCRAGQRALIYYKNPSTDDCSGGVEKPNNVYELPCDISCPAGTFLPPGALECQGCPAGTFSLSGGVRVGTWNGFPEEAVATGIKFETWSSNISAMGVHIAENGWKLLDEGALTIRSGAIKDNQASVLQLKTHLVKDGSVVFSFRVDCEQSYDGLKFFIDDVVAMNLTYGVHDLKTVSFPLSRGYHTLQWHYVKDISMARGADAAYIRLLEIDGTSFAADSCTPCPIGTASSVLNASACSYCPRDTYADVDGRTVCSLCPANQYAPVGSSECYDRYPCTEKDYIYTYGPCTYNSATRTYYRTKSYAWVDGTKCDSSHATLPETTTVECGACNPGMYRDPDGQCVACASGSASSGAIGEQCQACAAGEESRPGIYISEWYRVEELPKMATSCDGDCGTDGWVLDGSSVMSGYGHGPSVETTLQFSVTATRRTKMIVRYSIHCPAWDCRMSIYDINYSSSAYFAGQDNEDQIDLVPGEHTIQFVYSRFHAADDNNYAKIHKLVFLSSYSDGLVGTGGESCTRCKDGYYSTESMNWCEPCPSGKTNSSDNTQCDDCPENTYNNAEGSACLSCGTNVHSDPGSQACDTTCRFSPAENVTFDLSGLQKDTMYGPIYDSAQYAYYINLCSRFNSTRSGTAPCKDFYDDPIEGFACMLYHDCPDDRLCSDYNLGTNIDIYPLEGNKGFNLTYTGGDYGCGGFNRVTTVTMMCNPAAGTGVPGAWPNHSKIEGPDCHYNILWESVYGCPLCTEDDYTFVYGECKNGFRRMMYQWRTNPRACHDGVQLPRDEDVPSQCSAEVVCPLGQYYNEQTTNCTPCEPGTYSPGAGYAYYSFSSIPERFTTSCGSTGACTPYFTSNGKLHSGLGNSALVYTSQFFVDGFVNFTYSLISGDSVDDTSATHFNVLLDGVSLFGDLFEGSSIVSSKELSFPVSAGSHMITFEIDAFSSGSFVEIETMFIYGDRYAPVYCPICGEGLIAPKAATEMCTRCTGNTIADNSRTSCVACSDDKYTVDCKTCIEKAECTEDNYIALYTPCKDGKRSLRYVKVEPASVCQGGYVPPADKDDLECEPCPKGMSRAAGDECVGCPTGYYYEDASDTCLEATNGTIARNTVTFFESGVSGETQLPDGWSTFALMTSFPSGTVNGWRVGNGFVDCGPAAGEGHYVSVLEYKTTELLTDLKVQFEYLVSDEAHLRGSSLQFFVNDKMYDYVAVRRDSSVFVQSSPISIPYADSVTLRFVAHVWSGSLNAVSMQESDIRVRNVVISGLSKGVAKEELCSAGMESNDDHSRCVKCKAGFSNNVPGEMCHACAENTYAAFEGEDVCQGCYPGSNSEFEYGSTRCYTSCVFAFTANKYNMTALGGKVFGPVTSVSGGNQFYLSVCDGVMKKGECNSKAQDVAQMYVCAPGEDEERLNFGSELEFIDSASETSDTTVVLKYHVNSRNSHSSAACQGKDIVTTVYFRCDPSVGAGFPTLIPGDECSPTFTWTSQYACPVCGTDDYEEILGRCEGGLQRKELFRKSTAKCNGESRIFVEELECTDTVVLSIGVVIGCGGIILILIGVIIFVVYRNRQITVKYSKLLQSQEGDFEAMADEEAEREREKQQQASDPFASATTATF